MMSNGADKAVVDTSSTMKSKYNPAFTDSVLAATGPNADPRLVTVLHSLIRHVHDWAREIDLTVDEWMQGVELINWAGRMSDEKRNEGQLLCDVIGLESLVDEITFKLASNATDAATESAILGPFYRQNAPTYPNGSSIVHGIVDGDMTLMHGVVSDHQTGKPIPGAVVDIWHTAPNGLYEQQDEHQVEFNLRGKFTTDEEGKYNLYCLRPTSYPIPFDGPAGKLLQLLDRHPMRPAHIHVLLSAPGYHSIVTQIFDERDKHISDDSVFAVKDSLIAKFVPYEGDPKAKFQLTWDFRMTKMLKNV